MTKKIKPDDFEDSMTELILEEIVGGVKGPDLGSQILKAYGSGQHANINPITNQPKEFATIFFGNN